MSPCDKRQGRHPDGRLADEPGRAGWSTCSGPLRDATKASPIFQKRGDVGGVGTRPRRSGHLPPGQAIRSTAQYRSDLSGDDLAVEVDVQGHRRVGVAELGSDLARGEPSFVQAGGHGLAEGKRGGSRSRPLGATERTAGRRLARRRLDASSVADLALEGVQQLAQVAGDAVRVAQRAGERCREDQLGVRPVG